MAEGARRGAVRRGERLLFTGIRHLLLLKSQVRGKGQPWGVVHGSRGCDHTKGSSTTHGPRRKLLNIPGLHQGGDTMSGLASRHVTCAATESPCSGDPFHCLKILNTFAELHTSHTAALWPPSSTVKDPGDCIGPSCMMSVSGQLIRDLSSPLAMQLNVLTHLGIGCGRLG